MSGIGQVVRETDYPIAEQAEGRRLGEDSPISLARSRHTLPTQPRLHTSPSMADDTRAEDHHGLGSLSVRSRREGDAQVVELIGELDLAGASAVEAELLAAEATDAALIVVDLGGLEFIDSTGIRLIVMAAERSEDGRFTLLRGTKQVHRVFEITDLADRLPFVDA